MYREDADTSRELHYLTPPYPKTQGPTSLCVWEKLRFQLTVLPGVLQGKSWMSPGEPVLGAAAKVTFYTQHCTSSWSFSEEFISKEAALSSPTVYSANVKGDLTWINGNCTHELPVTFYISTGHDWILLTVIVGLWHSGHCPLRDYVKPGGSHYLSFPRVDIRRILLVLSLVSSSGCQLWAL